MPLYDAFCDWPIKLIHTRHEAATVFMAEAYAIASNQVGVALVTAGPGFGNALGALFSAKMSEVPLILLSGDSPTGLDGQRPFQELDQVAAALPFCKYSMRLTLDHDPSDFFDYAVALANAGVPGPVHIAMPVDVLNQHFVIGQSDSKKPINLPSIANPIAPDDSQIKRLVDAASTSERPLVVAGPHMFRGDVPNKLQALRDKLNVPVLVMDSPRGLRDPAKGDFSGLMAQADLLVYLGKPVDFTTGFAHANTLPHAQFLVINDTSQSIAKMNPEHLIEWQNATPSLTLEALLAADSANWPAPADTRSDWLHTADAAINQRDLRTSDTASEHSQQVVQTIASVLQKYPDAVLICDGGEFGQWAQAFISAKLRLTNGPGGAIGGGLPYAIGVSAARPDAPVIAIMGDGTVGFHLAELETAARVGSNITVIIGNDSKWQAEHHLQLQDYGEQRLLGCDLSEQVRYDLAAQSMGCQGALVSEHDQLESALENAIGHNGPDCLNLIIPGAPAPQFQPFAFPK